jgi:integrase
MAAVRKLRYEDIRKILVADYMASGKLIQQDGETLAAGRKGIFKALDEYFANMAVLSITTDALRDFVAKRMENGVSGPTCNRNLALLRRMFMLAKREGKIQNVPYFPMQKESSARKGFVEQAEFENLREALPENLRPLVTFLYSTGCRYGAANEIVWDWVKLDEGIIEVPSGVTKNGEALTLPMSTELVGMLKKMFRSDSKPVFDATNFRREWNKACVKVGLGKPMGKKWYQYSGLIPHDLRRSAVRNSIRAGVEQSTAMSISGHKTISVFQRYNIVDVKDKQAAMEKIERYNASSMLVTVAGGNG